MTNALAQSIEDLFDNPNALRLWLRLLIDATSQKPEYEGVSIERGQVIVSIRSLATKLGLSNGTLLRTFDTLEAKRYAVRSAKHKMERLSKHSFTLVTICDFDSYASIVSTEWNVPRNTTEWNVPQNVPQDNAEDCQLNAVETKEQSPKIKRFIPPPIEEVRAHIAEKGYTFTAEEFMDYYTANGWMLSKHTKVKNWKACCSTWERKRKEKANVNSAILKENEGLLSQYEAGNGGYGAFIHYIADNAPNVILKVNLPTQEEFALINENHRDYIKEALRVVNGNAWLHTTTFYTAFINAVNQIKHTIDDGNSEAARAARFARGEQFLAEQRERDKAFIQTYGTIFD